MSHGSPHAALLHVLGIAASLVVHHTQAKQQQLETNIRQVEQMAAAERDKAQAALLMSVVEAHRNLASRKVDLVFETYRATQAMIQANHASLLDERRDLARQRHEADETKETRMMRRISEIDMELMELSETSATLGMNANRMAQQVGLGLRLPTTALIEL